MPQACNPKVCIDCKKNYVPTSNVQKRCPDCMKNHKYTAPKMPKPPKANGARAASAPHLTVACTMQDTVAIFHALADAGCTCLVFGNTKITIEAL